LSRTILIADDHELFRSGLKEMLQQKLESWNIREANSYASTLQAMKEDTQILLALVDLRMPGMTDASILRNLAQNNMSIPVVIISASNDINEMRQCFCTGIMGYIPKNESAAIILSAIQLVLSGGVYVPPALLNFTEPAVQPKGLLAKLTPRQEHIFTLLSEGKSNKEIARTLNLSEATIKAHLASILKTLEVKNRTQAVVYAQKLGLDQPA
jgi:DNA-binding NarL/FixJ family response regulator